MNKKEANEKRKRDMFEEEEKQWNVKIRYSELEAKKCELTLKLQEEQQKGCMKKALDAKHPNGVKSYIEMANVARQSISENTAKLIEVQTKLKKVLSKRPKYTV